MKRKVSILHFVFIVFFLFYAEIFGLKDPFKPVQREYRIPVYGFINSEGKFIINPRYETAEDFSDSLAMVSSPGSGLYFINKNGDTAFDNKFRIYKGFSEGYAIIVDNFKKGYIDTSGRVVIKPTFSIANDFSEGLASVCYPDGERNVINKNGEIVIKSLPFLGVTSFVEGLASATVSSERVYDKKKDPEMEIKIFKIGFIDKKGEMVIPAKFNLVYPFSEGMALVNVGGWISTHGIEQFIGGKYGFINKDGNMVIKPRYSRAGSFSEGLAVVFVDKQGWGYIDKRGNQIIKPKYEGASSFSEGLAAVEIKGKYGYIDNKGKMIIEPAFDLQGMFSEGLAAVKVGEKWGYIDKTGKYIVEPKFTEAYSFSEGLARVQLYVEDVNINSKQ